LILLIIPSALILFGGDTQAVTAAVRPSAAMQFSDSAAVADFSGAPNLIAEAQSHYPDLHLRNIRFNNYGKEDGIMSLYFDDERTITGRAEVVYRVATEEVVFETGPGNATYADSVIATIGRLHFATYGGLGLKVMYFILALLTCFMIMGGVLLWQAARDKRSYTDKERRFHHRVTKANLAVCLGLIPAVPVIFLLNKLIPMDMAGRTTYVEVGFFVGWLLLIIAGLRWDQYRRINRNYLIVGGFLSLAVPVVNGLVTGDWVWSTLLGDLPYVGGVDLFWIGVGVISLLIARSIPMTKPPQEKAPRKKEKASTERITPAEEIVSEAILRAKGQRSLPGNAT
ncbi:MAG: PepSY-associated TM helix domain-containing protein, partial [Bacteroidota bacterium]